jgi:hypothetical protein
MIELVAAIAGAAIGLAGLAAGSAMKRSGEGREAIVKLTMGIEHIGHELAAIRSDMKEDRHEIYGRLNDAEQRLSSLEARQNRG